MVYRFVSFIMTLGDLGGHSPVAGLRPTKCISTSSTSSYSGHLFLVQCGQLSQLTVVCYLKFKFKYILPLSCR